VFIRVAKLMADDGKSVFHLWIAVNSPSAVNQQQVLKLARNYVEFTGLWRVLRKFL
jgi:hypothetical protein